MRIVSGGQTGVDRAALDAAIECGVEHGGWCPAGRLAEDGIIPQRYALRETPSSDYSQRTSWNVRDSDATLILTKGRLRGGSAYTRQCAIAMARPCLVVDIDLPEARGEIEKWLEQAPLVLNIAGPRESNNPGIYMAAKLMLLSVLS
ncbi:MAG: putative molybdenum carrier protein [Verrucomicrobiota bacterium]